MNISVDKEMLLHWNKIQDDYNTNVCPNAPLIERDKLLKSKDISQFTDDELLALNIYSCFKLKDYLKNKRQK